MTKDEILARITENPHLPSPPGISLQVLEKANSPGCTIADIGKIIANDPALCGKILKMVNSTLFGLPRAITSITRALNLLGIKRVRSLVMSLSLPSMQLREQDNPHMRNYWKLSVISGIVARELALRRDFADPDSETVTALLSDLGVLILQEVFPEDYARVTAQPIEILIDRQCAVEEEIFGVNHAEVSAHILSRWRMPAEVTQAILYHHHPGKAPFPYVERSYLLYFAQRMAQLQFTTDAVVGVGEIVSMAAERFGMNDKAFHAFLEPLSQKTAEFARLMQVDIGEYQQFPSLVASATENLTRMAVETSLDHFRVEEEKNQAQTKLRKTESELHLTEEKLRHALKMEAIGRLAGGVAHDFNNLLTVINGYSELLLNMMASDSPHRPLIDEIHKAGSRASELTRQLLAFSRKQILVPEVVRLNDAVSSMQKMLVRLIGENIELVTKLDPNLRIIKVDPGQLDQVIVNLAVNARDAMPQGGKLTIETSNADLREGMYIGDEECQGGQYVVLTLTDTGTGMSEEVKSQIFEPFFTTKGTKGTGLGLATVHGIVTQSGGHISLQSTLGKGTSFTIYIPALNEVASFKPKTIHDPAAQRGVETILITEDEEGVRGVARHILEAYGYKILEASNGVEALQVCKSFSGPIDLLLTDMVMPQMGGLELARHLKELRPTTKVLYASGYTEEVGEHGDRLGNAFLHKPFTAQGLTNKIRETLRGA